MMYTYNLSQWMLFFFFYCFFGWCFESTYVSVKEKQFVNRGFMHGPFLPIYGSGAISVLFTALPFRESPILVYFVGVLTATVLEYITGVAMEAIFKVRYWDYSNQKFNVKGQICLSSSIVWGFLSLGMVYGFHKPVEQWILSFPSEFTQIAALVLAVVFAADYAISFKMAFEFREILIKLQGLKEELRLMQKRLEVIEAVLSDEAQKRKERIKEELKEAFLPLKELQLKEELAQIKEKQIIYKDRLKNYVSKDKLRFLKRNPTAKSLRYAEIWDEIKEKIRDRDKK